MTQRAISNSQQVTSGLRQGGCHVCGRVIDPKNAVEHPQLGLLHERCKASLSFRGVGARSSRIDYEREGGGGAEYEE